MHPSHSSFHFPHLGLNKELTEIYLAIILRAMAFAMVGLFVPIYLIKELGLSLGDVARYYLVWVFAFVIVTLLAMKFACRFGFKRCILMSVPFDVLALGLLYSLQGTGLPYFTPAIAIGVANGFFWSGFHVHFAASSEKGKRGSEIGLLYALAAFFAVLGPLAGSLILTGYGFTWLFGIASGLLLASVIPLFFTREQHKVCTFNLEDIAKVFNGREFLAFIGLGMRYILVIVFWPLFIFLVLGTYLSLGIIASISAIVGAIFTLFVGRLSDKKDKEGFIRIGAFIHAVVFFFRSSVQSFTQVLLVDLTAGMSAVLGDVATDAKFYDRASESNRAAYVVFRELGLSVGRVIVLAAIMLTSNLAGSFVLGGIGSLLWMLY